MPEQPRQEDIDELMKVLAGSAAGRGPEPVAAPPPPKEPTSAPSGSKPAPVATARPEMGLDFLSDVDVQVRVELGSSKLNVKDVLKLNSGSVVALDSLVGDPVNVFVNDRLVARGEVLVVHDNFAIRITEVVPQPKTSE